MWARGDVPVLLTFSKTNRAWADYDLAVPGPTQKQRCADYVLAVPRYKTHPKENLGWGTLRVSLHAAKQ